MKNPLLLILQVFAFSLLNAAGFDQSHSAWNSLLERHVTATGVKYKALRSSQPTIKKYLGTLSAVSRKEFKSWPEADRLAFLINLYNAATVDLVLEHYPIKSFKDEVGAEGPWKLPVVKAFGKAYSLDDVEHKLIRAHYNEPRIHFALNCASEGCPPLRKEAFTGAKLAQQLHEQTTAFLHDKKTNAVKGKKVLLSPIFDWFKEDFIKKSGSVESFVDPYFPQVKIRKGAVKIEYTAYGWNLNEAH